MERVAKNVFLGVTGVLSVLLAGCQQQQQQQQKHVLPPVCAATPSHYERFVSGCKDYPSVMEVYLDDSLIKRADKKCQVVISLRQQRGRLYVGGKVAADWPVSTGADTHPTPPGRFRVRYKSKEYASNRYGKMFDAEGKCIDGNADAFTQPVPEGGRFEGSPMPNWMRLTADGIGMHTGKVKAGRRLSHGCIRLPHVISTMLFDIVEYGTRVIIYEDIEPDYPVAEIVARREISTAESAVVAEPESEL